MKNNYYKSMLIDKVDVFWISTFYIFLPPIIVLLGLSSRPQIINPIY